jgi:hypothetical protein
VAQNWIISAEKKEKVGFAMEQNHYNKGAEGEKYIAAELARFGYKVLYVGGCQLYSITGEKFYSVDLEPFKDGVTFWVQAKNKEPRKYYPDTGMERWRYKKLFEHQKETGLPILVLFTDSSKKIYGEWLDNLSNCESPSAFYKYNRKDNCEMIYWLLSKLQDYRELLKSVKPKSIEKI